MNDPSSSDPQQRDRLPAFSPDAFASWQSKAALTLEYLGLLDVVVEAPAVANAQSYMKKNARAKYLLMQALGDDWSEVDDKAHAYEMWKHLSDVYSITTIGGQLRLKSLWDNRLFSGSEPAQDFIRDLEKLRKDFNATVAKDSGVDKISDAAQLYKLLHSLPPDWDSFRMNMTLRPRDSLTYRDCKASFLEEAATRAQTALNERAMQALFRQQTQRGRVRNKEAPRRGDAAGKQQLMDEKKKTTACHRCGKVGHWKGDPACTGKQQANRAQATDDT